MLYINGELLNTRNRQETYGRSDLVKTYHETIASLRGQFGDVLRVQTSQKMRVDAKTGFPRYPGTRGLILQKAVATDSGMDEFVYSPTLLKVDDGVVKLKEPSLLVLRGETYIDIAKNPDLAFYCIHTGVVAKNGNLPGKFHIVDIEGMQRDEAEKIRIEGRFANLIFSAIPEGNLRTLAKSWGISDVDSKPLDSVRVELHTKVLADEKSKLSGGRGDFRGIREFIESSEVRFYDQVAALVSDAEDKKVLLYNEVDRRWEIDYKDNTTPYILKEMAGSEFGNPTESLIKFLVAEADKLNKLENAIGKSIEKKKDNQPPITGASMEEFPAVEAIMSETNYARLKSLAKKFVPEFEIKKGVGNDEIKEALLAKMAVVKETED